MRLSLNDDARISAGFDAFAVHRINYMDLEQRKLEKVPWIEFVYGA